MLPHLLQSTTYKDYYTHYAQGHKILDNGEAEGIRTSWHKLFDYASDVRADEIVVPDMLGRCDETIELARTFGKTAAKHPEYKYMGVVQGKNIAEVMKCLTAMGFMDYITTIGLPRILTKQLDREARARMADIMMEYEEFRRFEIHCLGSGSWTKEPILLTDQPNIRGIDTCMPISLGLEVKPINAFPYMARQKDFFNLNIENDFQRETVDRNIRTYCDWAGYDLKEAPSSQV